MYLTDFHVHSTISNDAENSMSEMAEASINAGINALCFTDHCDISHYETGKFDPGCFDAWSAAIPQFDKTCEMFGDRIDLHLGIELGDAVHAPEFAVGIAEREALDFIIGSVHSISGMPDFSQLKYESREQCMELLARYIGEHFETTELGCFDVLGHIGYPCRYMKMQGFDMDLSGFTDELAELFKRLIPTGRGIELNTSGLRRIIGDTVPSQPILKLYRELGGEIITVGSDAHRISDAGDRISDGYEILRQSGFKYVTVLEKRQPGFIKL